MRHRKDREREQAFVFLRPPQFPPTADESYQRTRKLFSVLSVLWLSFWIVWTIRDGLGRPLCLPCLRKRQKKGYLLLLRKTTCKTTSSDTCLRPTTGALYSEEAWWQGATGNAVRWGCKEGRAARCFIEFNQRTCLCAHLLCQAWFIRMCRFIHHVFLFYMISVTWGAGSMSIHHETSRVSDLFPSCDQ